MRYLLIIAVLFSTLIPSIQAQDEEEPEVTPVECLTEMGEEICDVYVSAIADTAATGSFNVEFTITWDYTDNAAVQSVIFNGDGAVAVTADAFDGAKLDIPDAIITLADGTTTSTTAGFILDAQVLTFGLGESLTDLDWRTVSDYQYGMLDLTLSQASKDLDARLASITAWELVDTELEDGTSVQLLTAEADDTTVAIVIDAEANTILDIQVQQQTEDLTQSMIFQLSDFGRFNGEIDLPDDFDPMSSEYTSALADFEGGFVDAVLRTFLVITLPEEGVPQAASSSNNYVSECFNRRTEDTPGSISLGETVEGFIESRTYDLWTFEGTAGETIDIMSETDFDGYMEVLAPDGSGLASDDLPENVLESQILGLTLPEDGTYSILFCIRPSMSNNTYTLTVSAPEAE